MWRVSFNFTIRTHLWILLDAMWPSGLGCTSLYRFLIQKEKTTGWIWGCVSSHIFFSNHYSLLTTCPVIHLYIEKPLGRVGVLLDCSDRWCCPEFLDIQVSSWHLKLFCQAFLLNQIHIITGKYNPNLVLKWFLLSMCFVLLLLLVNNKYYWI